MIPRGRNADRLEVRCSIARMCQSPRRARLVPVRELVLMVAACASASATASADPIRWEWRASAGAQIDSATHGTVDAGVRRGPFSVELFTDTLELKWSPESEHGRFWIAARGEAYAAGLLISPWTNGAPDRARALSARYVGLDGGWMRYLPASLYAGVHASVREYTFSARESTRIAVPDATTLGTVDVVLGRYSPDAHVWLRAGFDARPDVFAPHVSGEALWHPAAARPLAPIFELRAGWARSQDFLTLTRVGGLNPYVVPVAGAGWAEWWVENYLAARAGLLWQGEHAQAGVVIDVAAFDSDIKAGTALVAGAHGRRWFIDAALGYAPAILRQPDVSRTSLWILAGASWDGFSRASF